MSTEGEILKIEDKIVLSVDICSSTAILEDLQMTGHIQAWSDFLIWVKEYLVGKSGKLDFKMYKFTGDGWIILFNSNCSGTVIVPFLEDFCQAFKERLQKVEELLGLSPPDVMGVKFGMDSGRLVSIVMQGQTEYIGRPINMACRLQSAIKDKHEQPQYKAFITKPLYSDMKDNLLQYECEEVKSPLRNIAAGKSVRYVKLDLLRKTSSQLEKIDSSHKQGLQT